MALSSSISSPTLAYWWLPPRFPKVITETELNHPESTPRASSTGCLQQGAVALWAPPCPAPTSAGEQTWLSSDVLRVFPLLSLLIPDHSLNFKWSFVWLFCSFKINFGECLIVGFRKDYACVCPALQLSLFEISTSSRNKVLEIKPTV